MINTHNAHQIFAVYNFHIQYHLHNMNHSKSTNIHSVINAINCVKGDLVLLLGGKEKGETYDLLFNEIKNSKVKSVIICGESTKNMTLSAIKTGYADLHIVKSFDEAVLLADFLANDGDSVLLSPACSSFDMFSGYAERGEYFCELVKNLEKNE